MAVLSGALLITIGLLKYKSSKLERVEHELTTVTKKAEITEVQSKQKTVALENEQIEIEELVADVKKSRDERNASL